MCILQFAWWWRRQTSGEKRANAQINFVIMASLILQFINKRPASCGLFLCAFNNIRLSFRTMYVQLQEQLQTIHRGKSNLVSPNDDENTFTIFGSRILKKITYVRIWTSLSKRFQFFSHCCPCLPALYHFDLMKQLQHIWILCLSIYIFLAVHGSTSAHSISVQFYTNINNEQQVYICGFVIYNGLMSFHLFMVPRSKC